eukprot:1062563-Amphidinium_carterae.1
MRDYLERALRILDSHYGEEHPYVAITLTNLGIAHGALGDATKQRDYQERALRTAESFYGQEHPYVALALANLGVAHGCLGDAVKERVFFERGLRTFDSLCSAQQVANRNLQVFEASSLGAGHPGALACKRFLAEIESKMHCAGSAATMHPQPSLEQSGAVAQ